MQSVCLPVNSFPPSLASPAPSLFKKLFAKTHKCGKFAKFASYDVTWGTSSSLMPLSQISNNQAATQLCFCPILNILQVKQNISFHIKQRLGLFVSCQRLLESCRVDVQFLASSVLEAASDSRMSTVKKTYSLGPLIGPQ